MDVKYYSNFDTDDVYRNEIIFRNMATAEISVIVAGIILVIVGLMIPSQEDKIQQELDKIITMNNEILECGENVDCVKTKENIIKAYEINKNTFQMSENIKGVFFWFGIGIEAIVVVSKVIFR